MKKCLIIDDSDQDSEIKAISRDAESKGLELECHQFNVGSTFEHGLLTNGKIDIQKVVSEYKRRFRAVTFHFVAFDWELGDSDLDGVELIRQLSAVNILKNTPKCLYSGLLDNKLAEKLKAFKEEAVEKKYLIRYIKALIKNGVVDFVERDKYPQTLLTSITDTTESFDLMVEEQMKKYPNIKLKNQFGRSTLKDMTFSEISEKFETDLIAKNQFNKDILEQLIAYMTEDLQ